MFDLILIEGELGFGKPDPRIYARALDELGVSPSEAWMVGDNLEWDVAQPQRQGILGIWVDVRGTGLPPGQRVRPDRTIRRLSELKDLSTALEPGTSNPGPGTGTPNTNLEPGTWN